MLKHISQLTPDQQLHALIARPNWVAVCEETGAYLMRSDGRSRSGTGRRYFLISPKVKPGKLFDYGKWDYEDRKIFKAHSLAEAIQAANEKLEKMLAKRQEKTGNLPRASERSKEAMLEIMFVNGSDMEIVGPFYFIFTRGGNLRAARGDNSPGTGATAFLAEKTADGWLREGKTWREFSIQEVKAE